MPPTPAISRAPRSVPVIAPRHPGDFTPGSKKHLRHLRSAGSTSGRLRAPSDAAPALHTRSSRLEELPSGSAAAARLGEPARLRERDGPGGQRCPEAGPAARRCRPAARAAPGPRRGRAGGGQRPEAEGRGDPREGRAKRGTAGSGESGPRQGGAGTARGSQLAPTPGAPCAYLGHFPSSLLLPAGALQTAGSSPPPPRCAHFRPAARGGAGRGGRCAGPGPGAVSPEPAPPPPLPRPWPALGARPAGRGCGGAAGPGGAGVTLRHFLPLSPDLPKNARHDWEVAQRSRNVRRGGWSRAADTMDFLSCQQRGKGRDAAGTGPSSGAGEVRETPAHRAGLQG